MPDFNPHAGDGADQGRSRSFSEFEHEYDVVAKALDVGQKL